MIKINFIRQNDIITGFECKGHSGSAEAGQDIICAFVSSACFMVANTVTEVMHLNADARATDGYMKLEINEFAENAQDILNGLLLHLTELEKDYPQNIKVRCNNA